MRSMIFVLGLGLWLGLSCPALAGAFDGQWVADIPAQQGCPFAGTMTMVVASDALSGETRNSGGPVSIAHFTGKVEADGSATFTVNGRYAGTMMFNPDSFDATWYNGNCSRHAQGDRALDDAQQAALTTERRAHQDRYADLVRRAETGDKTVDYTALRREFGLCRALGLL